MKEIEIDSIKQFEKRLVISYSYTEGYQKTNHLGQVMSFSAEAGGGQITMDLKTPHSAGMMKDLLENHIQTIREGYF